MANGRIADLNLGTRSQIKLASQISMNSYSTFLFSVMSHDNWVATLQRGIGTYLYFGTFAGLTIFRAGLYLYDLIKSKNKNIGKVASFLREFIMAAILGTTIVGGLVGSIAISLATPWLFVASMIFNTTYNLIVALQNAYQWTMSEEDSLREKYKESFKKYMISTGLSAIATAGVALLMVVKVVPFAMAVFNACFNAFGVIVGIYSAIKIHQENKNEAKMFKEMLSSKQQLLKQENPSLKKLQKDFKDDKGTKQKAESTTQFVTKPFVNPKKDYYYTRDIASEMLEQDDPKNYLLQEINAKIADLEFEIHRDAGKFFSEATKRYVKILCLIDLKNIVQDSSKTIEDFYDLLKEPKFNKFLNNPFQSFFRKESYTQNLFKAAEILLLITKPEVVETEMRKNY